jgi:glycosyltransferase involved in cell wall biosynthesis
VAWIAGHTLRSRPTAVHAFLPLTNLLGALGARAGIARLVVTSRRSLGMYQDTHPRFGRIDRWSNRLSDIVVANSNAVAEAVAARDGYPLGRIVVIPNGVDMPEDAGPASRIALRHGLGLDEDALAIVSVANLVPYKGHMELIEAFGMVSGKHPAARLFIVGEDRGIGDRLRALVARHALGDRVTFLGSRNDVPVLLGAMDAGVLASHHEGNSNAVLEKLAAGLPVIATDVGGNTEAIAGLPGCQLVRPRDPADIARGLLSVLDRLPESGAIRDARRQAVRDHFSVTAMVEAYERLYLAGRRGRR